MVGVTRLRNALRWFGDKIRYSWFAWVHASIAISAAARGWAWLAAAHTLVACIWMLNEILEWRTRQNHAAHLTIAEHYISMFNRGVRQAHGFSQVTVRSNAAAPSALKE